MSAAPSAIVIRRLAAVLNGPHDQIDAGLTDLLAPELVYNDQRLPVQALCGAIVPLLIAVPDVHWSLEEVVAEGDRVASWWTVTGTHQADFHHPVLGRAPATHGPIRVVYTLFCCIEDGRIVEARDLSDRLALFQQLRVLPVLGLGEATHTIAQPA